MKRFNRLYLLFLSAALLFSCTNDLNRFPSNDFNAMDAYSDFNGYKSVLAKVYAAYATIGNNTTGNDDIPISDGALTDFIRCWFSLQTVTTEEASYTWPNDAYMYDLQYMMWTPTNIIIAGLYYRCLYQITLVNEFLRESTPAKLSERGITGEQAKEIACFRAEARFLRAFQYWVLMDFVGNPPFVDESTPIGKYLPQQIARKDLFTYIEKELLEISSEMKAPRTNEYGRADRAAAWSLLARIYLNAEVYTGEARYTDAITYARQVIGAGYTLKNNYAELFLADNHLNNPEVILSINYDGLYTQGYGGTTFIINMSFKPRRDDDPSGTNFNDYYGSEGQGGWYGIRARKQLTEKFDAADGRRLFFGTVEDITDIQNFEQGMMVAKFRNVTSSGEKGSNPTAMFTDTDFPLFRLADIYLIYAESVLRGGNGGTQAEALNYVNALRERAFGNTSHNFSSINLNDILDERARELYWECQRRTDLVRYGLYTGSTYLWQWKGGVQSGKAVSEHLNLFPIPSSDKISNPNLVQNPNY